MRMHGPPQVGGMGTCIEEHGEASVSSKILVGRVGNPKKAPYKDKNNIKPPHGEKGPPIRRNI